MSGSMSLEQSIAQSMNDPARNLFGNYGHRCVPCSGLGSVLAFPGAGGRATRQASRCSCGGSGLDLPLMREGQIRSLQDTIALYDRRAMEHATRIARLEKRLLKQPRVPKVMNSRQYWEELIAWATADGVAVANTTTEAIIFPNVTFPANYMSDGRRIRGSAAGKLSTTATPTMTWTIRWGGVTGTVIGISELITMGSGVANVNWRLEFTIQTRTNGATGTVFCFGELHVHTSATAILSNVFSVSGFDAPAAVTVDLTSDTALSLTADWSAASASNTLTGHDYALESLN